MTKIIGEAWAEIENDDGKKTVIYLGRNLVTDTGENLMAWALTGSAGYRGFVFQMELGTGIDAAAEENERLQYPITQKPVYGSASGSIVDFKASWTAPEANTILGEAGLWASGDQGSSLFSHLIFTTPVTKQSGQPLDITYKITFD